MCPYCEKTFKTNVNCKKHMKTHIGSLTAQNPIGNNNKHLVHSITLVSGFSCSHKWPGVKTWAPADISHES